MSKQKHPPNKSSTIPSPQISQADLAKSEKGTAVKLIAQQIREISTFSGPLPPPEVIEHYNKIIPNGADRLLEMVELQSEHRRACEEIGLCQYLNIKTRTDSCFSAFLSWIWNSRIMCIFSTTCTINSLIGGGTLLGLASLFIKGYSIKKFAKKDDVSKE